MKVFERKRWTRDELILAINLYCKTQFGKIHMRNPEIIDLANKLERTPGSVSYKLANFSSIDPTIERKGAANVSKLDREVWNEFFEDWESMAFESEMRMAKMSENESVKAYEVIPLKDGETKSSTVQVRVNQNFFRKMILTSYNNSCCITGIDNCDLLIASHIVPWAHDKKNRLNPMNGLCLNALHDRAFDKGLITIDDNYQVLVSNKVTHELIVKYDRKLITLPSRFLPDKDFINFHRKNIFKDN
ncbi:MAG: HNH endonuclease [Desulfobacterales bacterium]|nr:HNH endonuclease [Desulfobacterales bacterium]MDD4073369.1 HNH endonuclease [Desulfobacterales bacterium]MDD4393880.1 HNH endonuclease [Desulfobacterales bacterium]